MRRLGRGRFVACQFLPRSSIETGAGTYQRETHIGISFMRLSKSRTSYWRLLNSVAFLSRYAT